MSTILTLLLVAFFIMIGVFGFMIYLDMKPQVAAAPHFNYADGSADVSTAEATATHHEDKVTGEIRAHASVDGLGKAQASAELGHEFRYTGKEPKRFKLKIAYGYRTHVQVEEGAAQSRAIVNAVLLPDAVHEVANDVQTAVGQKDISTQESFTPPPSTGGTLSEFFGQKSVNRSPLGQALISGIQEFPVSLDRNQKCKALLKVTAIAEATDEAQKAKCHTEVVGKVTGISLIPQ